MSLNFIAFVLSTWFVVASTVFVLTKSYFNYKIFALKSKIDSALSDMNTMAFSMRESDEMQESPCFACKYSSENNDCVCCSDECPGFYQDDCFEWRGV